MIKLIHIDNINIHIVFDTFIIIDVVLDKFFCLYILVTPILILMPCIVVTPRCPKTLLQAMMPAPHSFLPRTRPAWYNIVQFYWTVAIGIHYIPYHTILYHTVLHCTIPHNNHTQSYIWHGT